MTILMNWNIFSKNFNTRTSDQRVWSFQPIKLKTTNTNSFNKIRTNVWLNDLISFQKKGFYVYLYLIPAGRPTRSLSKLVTRGLHVVFTFIRHLSVLSPLIHHHLLRHLFKSSTTDTDGCTIHVHYNCVHLYLPPRGNLGIWMRQQRAVTRRPFLTCREWQRGGTSLTGPLR